MSQFLENREGVAKHRNRDFGKRTQQLTSSMRKDVTSVHPHDQKTLINDFSVYGILLI